MNLLLIAAIAAPAFAQRLVVPAARPAAPAVPVVGIPGLTPALDAPSLLAPSLTPSPLPSLPAAALPTPAVAVAARAAAAAPAAAHAFSPAAARAASASVPADSPSRNAAAATSGRMRALSRRFVNGAAESRLSNIFDGTRTMYHPPLETWRAGDREFGSTARLVGELPDSAAPVAASYTFGARTSVSRRERAANTAIGAVSGGVFGGLGGTLLGMLAGFAVPLLGVILGDPTAGVTYGAITAMAGMFAGFGALFGLVIGFAEGGAPARSSLTGELYRHDGRLLFRTRGDKPLTVDLDAYSKAEALPAPTTPALWPLWKRAAAGAAAAAAVALATALPLVQIIGLWVAGPMAGAMAGSALTAGTEVRGGVLGGAIGALLPASMFWVLASAPYGMQLAWLGWWVLALTLAGAALGALFANPVLRGLARRDAEAPADQWWSGPAR